MNLQGKTAITANLSSLLAAYGGKQILIRIAAVNNTGPLIVGVDNVSLTSMYTDTTPPTFPGQPELRNPGYLVGNNLDSTTDPTLVGQVADSGGVNNIAYVAFSPTGDTTFNKPGDIRISALSLDATGHFSVTLPNPVYGLNTVNVEVVDKAGNATMGTPIDFVYQGPSVTDWQAVGPGGISTANSGAQAQYSSVSGRVNSVLVDTQDPSGDTYLVGSDNGGVWKTTDGGADWTPATDYISEGSTPISTPIGALAGAVNTSTNQFVVYAGTGDANPMPDSRAGSGILVSTDGGNTFEVAGNSDVVLAGARISSMAVDPDNTNIAWAGVASGGEFGPGVYETIDGGAHWTNVLTTATMNLTALGFPTGTTLASVTDISLNSHDPSILTIGLGNIGLVGASATAGVWTSQNADQIVNGQPDVSWSPVLGGLNPNIQNSTLPVRGRAVPSAASPSAGSRWLRVSAPPTTSPRSTYSSPLLRRPTRCPGTSSTSAPRWTAPSTRRRPGPPATTTRPRSTASTRTAARSRATTPGRTSCYGSRRAPTSPTNRRFTTSISPAWTAATPGRSSSIRPTRTWSTSAPRRSTLTPLPRVSTPRRTSACSASTPATCSA